MAKPKQRQKKSNSSPSGLQVDPQVEDDWVMVKTQKVTILIPPLPVTKQSAMPNSEESNPQTAPIKTTTNAQLHVTKQPDIPQIQSVLEKENSIPLSPVNTTLPSTTRVPSRQPVQQIPNLGRRTGLGNLQVDDSRFRLRAKRALGVCSASKRWRSVIDNEGVLANHSIRALNVERKLRRAGGLRRWLASLGLDQFVRIFQGKVVGKFQLVNLTMKKLKDMGAVAVGPRRKLIHAIDCLCQPYCFKAL
ncbi:hypothetical protein LguiA_024404 [Lonicera macranthoides]